MSKSGRQYIFVVMISLLFSLIVAGQTHQPSKERVEAIKTSFQKSQAVLRKYEWIETMVVNVKGEDKSSKQNRCYYGAEGKIQKVEISATQGETPGGLRGRIAKHKKEEMTEYMQQAVETIKQYVSPDAALIQKSFQSGHAAIYPTQPGKATSISFGSYLKPNDNLMVDIDTANNIIKGVQIQTYIDSPEDAVSLNVFFSIFPDGTIYTSKTVLNAPAKEIKVTMQNSGYRPMN
ncbi:hypothetical protein L0152_28210 [bacterium]|nr:hypothetical protein [bacterium]